MTNFSWCRWIEEQLGRDDGVTRRKVPPKGAKVESLESRALLSAAGDCGMPLPLVVSDAGGNGADAPDVDGPSEQFVLSGHHKSGKHSGRGAVELSATARKKPFSFFSTDQMTIQEGDDLVFSVFTDRPAKKDLTGKLTLVELPPPGASLKSGGVGRNGDPSTTVSVTVTILHDQTQGMGTCTGTALDDDVNDGTDQYLLTLNKMKGTKVSKHGGNTITVSVIDDDAGT